MSAEPTPPEDPSRLLSAVRAISISAADAHSLVENYRRQAERDAPDDGIHALQDRVAAKIVARYSKLSAMAGGASALPGVIPGAGTAIAIGGALADTAVSMKFQVDMTMCLAAAYGYDLSNEDAQHLAFLIAVTGSLEKAGVSVGTQVASKAGVRLLREYLRGATLQILKQLFKKLGIIFTRKSLEKIIPFGVGVVIGAGANYALTRFVGKQATEWFRLDREQGGPDATLNRDA